MGLADRLLPSVAPRPGEVAAGLPGDDLVPHADVVMDRAFPVAAPPEVVWPWLEQLGKGRAGWYLPRRVERAVPSSRRAIRHLDPSYGGLRVGDVIPDYGGRDETFTVAMTAAPSYLVHTSRRRRTDVSWAIVLTPEGTGTRVHLRLRLGPVRHVRVAEVVGGWFDALTIAGLAAGLRERV
jgi:hypothetical protein